MSKTELLSVLELTPSADLKRIKQAYSKALLKYHPDVNHDSLSTEKFKRISALYRDFRASLAQGTFASARKTCRSLIKTSKKTSLRAQLHTFLARLRGRVDKFTLTIKTAPVTLNMDIDELMARLVSSSNEYVRYESAKVVRLKIKKDSVWKLLDVFDQETSVIVREVLVRIFSDHRLFQSVDRIVRCLKSKDENLRTTAIRALARIGSIKALDPLFRIAQTEDGSVKKEALKALRSFSPKIRKFLLENN